MVTGHVSFVQWDNPSHLSLQRPLASAIIGQKKSPSCGQPGHSDALR
jgi:hypothetical protein